MIKKIALLASSLTAALVIAGGLALARTGAPAPAADMQVVNQAVVPVDSTRPADAPPTVQVDTIYLAPQPTPQEITVTQVKEATRQAGDGEAAESGQGQDD